MRKVKLKKGSMRNQCPACGELFTTVGNFDKHRTGKFSVDRRCRTPDELLSLGLHQDGGGWWRQDAPTQHEYTPQKALAEG